MGLGEKIGQYRRSLGISQEELGARLGVSRQAVSKWETGAATPDMANLMALAREFGVSVAELTETPEEPQSVAELTEPPEPPPQAARLSTRARVKSIAKNFFILFILLSDSEEPKFPPAHRPVFPGAKSFSSASQDLPSLVCGLFYVVFSNFAR